MGIHAVSFINSSSIEVTKIYSADTLYNAEMGKDLDKYKEKGELGKEAGLEDIKVHVTCHIKHQVKLNAEDCSLRLID